MTVCLVYYLVCLLVCLLLVHENGRLFNRGSVCPLVYTYCSWAFILPFFSLGVDEEEFGLGEVEHNRTQDDRKCHVTVYLFVCLFACLLVHELLIIIQHITGGEGRKMEVIQ